MCERTAAARTRIVLASYERLIIAYSSQDKTVYVLAPAGEDPKAVLYAARLILPEGIYRELADHYGIPAGLPLD